MSNYVSDGTLSRGIFIGELEVRKDVNDSGIEPIVQATLLKRYSQG